MTISNSTFVQGIYSYLRDYPKAIDAQTQDTLTTLAKTSFATAEEARLALAEFVEMVQRSDKSGLKRIVQALFDQEITQLVSAPAAEESLEKRPRLETGNTDISTSSLPQDPLAHIFSFLDKQSQGRAAQVCRDFRGAIRLRRIYDVSPFLIQLQSLDTPEFRALSSLFGISLPPPNPSSAEISAACESLFANVPHILEGVKTSGVLSDEEKKPFSTMSALEIVQDPSLLEKLLRTAYEISLVAPFLKAGILSSMTLAEKAEAVRKHLKENGDSYTDLECNYHGMLCFPRELCSLQNLQTLNLVGNSLTSIPAEIGQLAKLQSIFLSNNHLTSIPSEIGRLEHLVELDLSGNRLTTIPAEVGRLTQLRKLDLSGNRLTSIPSEIGQLTQLPWLDLRNNRLTTLPAEVGQLTKLSWLDLGGNRLITIPAEIGRLTQLQNLNLNDNRLTTIPTEIGQLAQLQWLCLDDNHLTTIPAGIEGLAQLRKLFIDNNRLISIPAEIGRLANLQELSLNNNRLASIPAEIGRLAQLGRLYIKGNHLTTIPAQIGQLAQLESLFLGNNRLATLPAEIGRLAQLQGLELSNNLITTLPAEVWRYTQRIDILLADNPLTEIPKSTKNIRIIIL